MRRVVIVLMGIAVLGAAGTGLVWVRRHRSHHATAAEAAAPARPLAAPQGDAAPSASAEVFLGVVLADQTVDIVARGEGRIKEIMVRLGDRVSRDAVVATLEATTVKEDLAMAEAALSAAQAEQEKAVLEADQAHERLLRREPLAQGTPAISGEELSSTRYADRLASSRVKGARASVAEKAARVKQLRALVQETAIRAPFDGIVAARYVDIGAVVGPTTSILRLINPQTLRVRFAVPEARAGAVEAGMKVQIEVESFAAVEGRIEKVAPEIDAASRMVFAEARIEVPANWKGQLRSGLVARVRVVSPATALSPN